MAVVNVSTEEFLAKGCCKANCIREFQIADIERIRDSFFDLTSEEKDIFVLSLFVNWFKPGDTFDAVDYRIEGRKLCRQAFLFLINISKTKLQNLRQHYNQEGLQSRRHGNVGRAPPNSHLFETRETVKNFIENYADNHGVILPGRIPGYRDASIILLSSAETKLNVYRFYKECCEKSELASVASTTFYDLWQQLLPWIVIAKPATDLCWRCQKNNTKIFNSSNCTEGEKLVVLQDQLDHLDNAEKEREHYRKQCKEAQNDLKNFPDYNKLGKYPPCSFDGTTHISWDYAQQVHYPSNPFQPGPIYFKATRKCGIFGICDDAVNFQVNYLIDEIVSTGKGANTTISYVHHYLENYSTGSTRLLIHADNCVGQNKNNFFIMYLLWRVMSGLNDFIEYSFMTVGHTKFSCDRCFGSFKKKANLNQLHTLYDVGKVCDESADCNMSQLVGTHDGSVLVPCYDWQTFLSVFFNKIPNVTDYQHYVFTKDKPGIVNCSIRLQDKAVRCDILKKKAQPIVPGQLPDVVQPNGFSAERESYLYKEIRQFCEEGTEDLVAPTPKSKRPRT